MGQSLCDTPLLRHRQSSEKQLPIGSKETITIEANCAGNEETPRGLQSLSLGQTSLKVAIELDKKCRCCNVIDVPESTDCTTSSRLKRQTRESKFAVLVTECCAASAEDKEVQWLTFTSLAHG